MRHLLLFLALGAGTAVASPPPSSTPAGIGLASKRPARVGAYQMKWPVTGVATSPVGPRWGRLHAGRDIACRYAPVRAAFGGRVSRLGNDPNGYGLYIDIAHTAGYMTRYAHLSRYGVSMNQQVALGDVIATSGNTGSSTGPHLHFEVRRNGSVQTPYWDAGIPMTTHRHTDHIPFDFPGLGGGSSPAMVRGYLYDARRGSTVRVASGTVSLESGAYAVSDTTGYFEFRLAAGTRRLAATAPGFDPSTRSISVPASGEVWASIALWSAAVPELTATRTPAAGAALGIRLRGDPGSPAVGILATRPAVPALDLRSLGLGYVWTELQGAIQTPLGSVAASGVLTSSLRAPAWAGGVRLHLQAIVRSSGSFRLSNGTALTIR